MAEAETTKTESAKKSSKLPVIIGVFLAIAGGGGGFYAASSGLLSFVDSHKGTQNHQNAHVPTQKNESRSAVLADRAFDVNTIAFVPIDPLLISLGPGANARHLRFKGKIETPKEFADEVELLMPRIVDVLNSYLRAVEETDLERPAALVRLRAQMLRRIQIVSGPGRVNDLLVMEFVLN